MIPEKSITFAIHTIGCKTNQAEADDIARQLIFRGCSQAEISEANDVAAGIEAAGTEAAGTAAAGTAADTDIVDVAAGTATAANAVAEVAVGSKPIDCIDYIIINTCTVTSAADRKARHLIRKLKSASPQSKLIITGCFAELNRELIKEISADFIFSNNKKNEIADFICREVYEKAGLINGLEQKDKEVRTVKVDPASTAGQSAKASVAATAPATAVDLVTSTSDPTESVGQTTKKGVATAAAIVTSATVPAETAATISIYEPVPMAAAAAIIQIPDTAEAVYATAEPQHTHSRAFVKIQDGCQQGCSYCIVPQARGPYLSTDPEKIIEDIKNLVSLGHDEIVLAGIHIGKFGVDLLSKKTAIKTLPGLVLEILKNTGVKRLRLSSIEINEIDECLIDVIRNNRTRVASHLHIPMQSGSDNVLKAMNRRYDNGFFISAIDHLKKAIPGITLTTDIIVGFPGETAQDFIKTVEMVKNIDFNKIHVFKYSIRPGTKAADMAGQVQEKIKTERSRILRELGLDLRSSFVDSNISKKLDVVCEEYDRKSGIASGTSENYIKVYFDLNYEEYKLKKARILKVFIKSLYAEGLYGEVI